MREEIKNYREIIEDYYKRKYGIDVIFDFMHVTITYSYIQLQEPIYKIHSLKNGEVSVRYEDRRETMSQTIFVPFVVDPKYYNENFADDLYYMKRHIGAKGVVDIGSSDNFNYEGVYKKIDEVIPKECKVISEEELRKIAKEQGYDNIQWKIYDKARGLPPIAYSGPEWVNIVYGVREK